MGTPNRAWIGVALIIGFAAVSVAADLPAKQDDAATIVYVSAEGAQLRSGPGEDFYPTGDIPLNASLEVYHRTEDEWLGVRPPEGSFSWVQAADAYLLPGGRIIEVTNPSAVSWIGTSLGSAKQYRWQVKLTSGEQLGVIGEQSTRNAEGKEVLWYKIAPPAGEFRWIHTQSVSSQPVTPSSSARTAPGARASSGVVAAAYQAGSDDGVITLGTSDEYYDGQAQSTQPFIVEGSYPRTPKAGEVIDGEVVVDESYAPGQIIEGEPIGEGAIYGNPVEGDYIGGEYLAGEYVDGGTIEGQIVDDGYGEVIYEDAEYVDGVAPSGGGGTFAGWHAMELNDDGMRFTWLERMYGRAKQSGPDPLQADPFSLAMHKGQVRPNSPRAFEQMYPDGIPQVETVTTAPVSRRHRPWRDPRTLGNQRTGGVGSPHMAPALSSRDAGRAGQDLPSEERTAPLSAGLQRLSSALQGGTGSLAAYQSSQPNPATDNVNWYGIGQGTETASPPVAQSSGAANIDALQTAAAANVDLNQLQLVLSEAVTQPMQLWSLQPIYESARYYVEHGGSAIERGRARLLMERIEEFAELAARSGYLALNRTSLTYSGSDTSGSNATGASGAIMLASTSSGSISGVVQSDFDRAIGGDSSYDATGWLVPVIAASAGQPSHALTDDTGKILSYVSPVPGLNLDRYLNQAVGITGLRGYLPQLQAGHLQASRVVRLK
ncbi:MAG: hypothetical protein R3C09_27365 [Pirellulaceae bacterium]